MSSGILRHSAAASTPRTCAGQSRCNCVVVRASGQASAPAPAAVAAAAAASLSSRRELLLGASAAAVAASQLLLPGSAPAASVIDNDDDESVSTAGAAVQEQAPAQQPPAIVGRDVTTPEGVVRLRTNDEATGSMTPTDKQIFALNRRVQAQNRSPDDFPGFIREGFDITVIGEGYQIDSTNGLIYKDFVPGNGSQPVDGQQVIFDYTGYNESGTIIDSSYRKGRAAEVRLGINGLIPGFELGIKGMKPGGKRRIVVPPALGPPVGPSTFFSAKQCEVFDVELRQVKTCTRRQMAMFSDVVCE